MRGTSRLIRVKLIILLITLTADQINMTMDEVNTAASTVQMEGGSMGRKKAHFVLVHGFGGGAWSWYKVRYLLEASGHKVTCLDLKSAGIDLTHVDSVRSFQDYNQPLLDFFSNYTPSSQHGDSRSSSDGEHDCNGKVILVGHSAGGLSVTQASYLFGNKISVAVYVAATMLKHGLATHQDIIDGVPRGFQSPLTPQRLTRLGVNHDISNTTMTNDKEYLSDINYHMSPSEDDILNKMLQRPGPLKVLLEDARFLGRIVDGIENVPRIYIKTIQDQVLKPVQQEAMINRWPPSFVLSLDSDHNPIMSTPFQLAIMLTQISNFHCVT